MGFNPLQRRGAKGTDLGGEFVGPKSVAHALIKFLRGKGEHGHANAVERMMAPRPHGGVGSFTTRGGSRVHVALPSRPMRTDDRIQDPTDPRRMGVVAWVHGDQMRVNWDDGSHEVKPVERVHDPLQEPRRTYQTPQSPAMAKIDRAVGGPRREMTPQERRQEVVAAGKVDNNTATRLLRGESAASIVDDRTQQGHRERLAAAAERMGVKLPEEPKAARGPLSAQQRDILQRAHAAGGRAGILEDVRHDPAVNDLRERGLIRVFPQKGTVEITAAGRRELNPKSPAVAKVARAKAPEPYRGSREEADAIDALRGRSVADINHVAREVGVTIPTSMKSPDARAEFVARSLSSFSASDIPAAEQIRDALAQRDGAVSARRAGGDVPGMVEKLRGLTGPNLEVQAIQQVAADPGMTQAKLRQVADGLGVDLPPDMRAKTSMQMHIAREVGAGRLGPARTSPAVAKVAKAAPAKRAAAGVTVTLGELNAMSSREQVATRLASVGKPELLAMARSLYIPRASTLKVADLRREIVDATVGRRIDSIATRGFTGPRP